MNTLKKWLVNLFCLALLSVANLYITAQPSHIVGEFKGTVYFIPQDEIMMGYGEHVYDNDMIGEVSSSALQFPEADQFEKPFPADEPFYSCLNNLDAKQFTLFDFNLFHCSPIFLDANSSLIS